MRRKTRPRLICGHVFYRLFYKTRYFLQISYSSLFLNYLFSKINLLLFYLVCLLFHLSTSVWLNLLMFLNTNRLIKTQAAEYVVYRCSFKQVFLKIFQISQENTFRPATLLKKGSITGVFSHFYRTHPLLSIFEVSWSLF